MSARRRQRGVMTHAPISVADHEVLQSEVGGIANTLMRSERLSIQPRRRGTVLELERGVGGQGCTHSMLAGRPALLGYCCAMSSCTCCEP